MMLAQFNYYSIGRIIDGSHLPPTVEPMLSYWLEIEKLFILAFADSIPAGIFEETRIQESLRDKWITILKNYTHTDLGQITTDLFNVKFETKEKISDFVIKLHEIWENLARCGHIMNPIFRIEQFMSKMEPIFPNETRELRRSRDIRTLTWDYVVQT